MEMNVLIIYAEGHANGRTEIKKFSEVMKEMNISADKLNELISSGEKFNGKFFDEALTIK